MELSIEHIKLMVFNEFEKGSCPIDAMNKVCSIYGRSLVNESQLQYWYSMFQRKYSLQDRPKSERLRALLAKDPNINVHKLCKELQLSYLTAQNCLKSFKNQSSLDTSETDLPTTDEDEENLDDKNILNTSELDQCFQTKYRISDESAVTLNKNYVLNLCHDGAFTRIAAGLSNGEVQIFDINSGDSMSYTKIDCIKPPFARDKEERINICGVQFLDDTNNNTLLIGTTNGLVRLYDLRTSRIESRFVQEKNGTCGKYITCFERNANSRVLCMGTEAYNDSVYLIFYDIRKCMQFGCYSKSHNEDITALRFHSRNPDLLCSGSTDGLINIFDILQTNEDDALQTTINTESSVQKLSWHKNVYEKDILSCITHTDFKTYECEEGDLIAEFERNKITNSMKRTNPANCNLINAHNMEDGSVFLLAGTYSNRGEVLRSLRLQNKELLPLADFDGNRQIVRESIYNAKNQALITAGESGFITLWTPETFGTAGHLPSCSNKLKSKTKLSSSKKNPY